MTSGLPPVGECHDTLYKYAVCHRDFGSNIPCPRHDRMAFEVWYVAKYDFPAAGAWDESATGDDSVSMHVSLLLGLPFLRVRFALRGGNPAFPWGAAGRVSAVDLRYQTLDELLSDHCAARREVGPNRIIQFVHEQKLEEAINEGRLLPRYPFYHEPSF